MACPKNYLLFSVELWLLLLCCSSFEFVSAVKIIKELPGYQGSLPFSLETGYVEVDEEKGMELFYYFVESESKPEEDPLLLWLSGGPGCSSIAGFMVEIGPLNFDLEGYTDGLPDLFYTSESWTKVSNIIFVDSPVGTGFSYSRTDGFVPGDTKSADHLLIFLNKWLEDHPKFKSNPLYIGGDSYAGKIIPVLTLKIAIAKELDGEPFNLKGYLAGNPLTDVNFDLGAKVPFVHGMGHISDELYESTKRSCAGNYAYPINVQCSNHIDAVNEVVKYINDEHILEPYCKVDSDNPRERINNRNRRRHFDDKLILSKSSVRLDCRSSRSILAQFWATNDTVREALGIHKGTAPSWEACKYIDYEFDLNSTVEYHLNITKKGYPALIYSGDHDMIAPFIGTQNWIRSLNFSIVDDWRPWYVRNQVAGFTRIYSNNLTFATVKGAGHTAPEYKQKECLSMFSRWISGNPL